MWVHYLFMCLNSEFVVSCFDTFFPQTGTINGSQFHNTSPPLQPCALLLSTCQLKFIFPFLSWVRHSRQISLLPHFPWFLLQSFFHPLECLFFFFTPLHILAYLFFEIVLTNSSFISPSQNVVKSLLILSCREIIFIKVKQLFFFTTFYFTMSNWDNRHLFWQPTAKISSWWMVMTVLEKFFTWYQVFFYPVWCDQNHGRSGMKPTDWGETGLMWLLSD